MRLLVAVSNEPLAHAIHGALLAGRHEVSLASTGSIALAAVAKESFDAVILDESLLGISTEQLIESLRNARASVKILLLTSTPLSKTIGEGSRWRALPDEYAPIEETPYSSFSANSRANNSDAEAEQRSDNAASSAQANVRRPDAALSKPFSDGELLSYVGLACHRLPRHDHSWQSHVGHHESQGLLRIHSQRNLTVPSGIQFA